MSLMGIGYYNKIIGNGKNNDVMNVTVRLVCLCKVRYFNSEKSGFARYSKRNNLDYVWYSNSKSSV